MQLSKLERLTLVNQYKILAMLADDSTDVEHYEAAQDVFEMGYEFEYSRFFQNINEDALSASECREVIHILSMFDLLQLSYADLKDKSGIDEQWTTFRGFDGNNESMHACYAGYLKKQGKFADLRLELNSHCPVLPVYRRMLNAWQGVNVTNPLSKSDILKLTTAAHPSPTSEPETSDDS